ncbi:urokinase plasminogen activator surface receptor-like isoform X1 [Oreochromis aureus]|uniref:urokinase plasminogen activator surface receptor-like isoform X1 n=1 Tax=Oreochromis aureus TaxID=47969 RepID=UPI00195378DB|nr:urokinase plasminogen activator surface receptor-like isoform X1 [Oreochromis aureus]
MAEARQRETSPVVSVSSFPCFAACALKCFECRLGPSGSCTETKDCPSNTQCGSFRLTSYAGGTKTDVKERGCAAAEECVQASVNYGVIQNLITSKCCTSDLCNSQDAPEGSICPPNGKKCFYCDGTNCTKTLNCNGNEDYCISRVTAVGQEVTAKGCASKQICSAELSALIGEEISCCQGDLCNSGSSTTVGLLLFVTPLISLVLFS